MELPTSTDLRERRTELELTQSDLADRAGVSQPLIARIESGDVDPRLSTLRRIVNALQEAEGGLLRARDLMHTDVVGVAPDDSVREAISLMLEEGYSQLPVIRDEYPVGIISNGDVRRLGGEGGEGNAGSLPVAEAMRESITTVTTDTTLDEVDAHLDHHEAVIVIEEGHVAGIVTEADVAAHLS
ncbi:transcriptional regulator [Halobacteriales archaeon QS_8_65_32]|nr:MAG: transcriptional regulator [Halobacteriales archaeon QS_8_65_32]